MEVFADVILSAHYLFHIPSRVVVETLTRVTEQERIRGV